MTNDSKKIVFFDLDGTILEGISSENAFFCHLLFNGYIGLRQFLITSYCMIKWLPKFKLHAFIKNKSYLYGLSTEETAQLAKKFVQDKLLKKIRPKLRERIEEHRAAGDRLILLTGSLEFLASEFASELNIPEVCATHCVHHFGQFTHLLPTQHPYAAEKLKLAKEICEKYHVDIKDCAAYGNSINDKFILEAVGKAVAVTPHKSLRKIAAKEGWEILDM